jgi:hypothetical protein
MHDYYGIRNKCNILKQNLSSMKAIRPVLVVFLFALTNLASAMQNIHRLTTEDTTGLITLPVRWLDFNVTQHENSVLLKWSTLHEQGIKSFAVERSDTGNDFKVLGSVIANGNSSTYQEYQFEDPQPLPGHSYYRITSEDENGFRTISLIRKVHYNNHAHSNPLELRNVFVSGKTIHFSPVINTQKQSRLYIYTHAGRLALTTIVNNHTTQVQASSLKGGIYFLSTGYQAKSIVVGN